MSVFGQLRDGSGFNADCTPNSELIVTDKFRLVGSVFNGSTLDTNFWTKAESTGTVAQTGSELILTSGTANAHFAKIYSVRRANWMTGTSNKYRSQLRFGDSGTTNVNRRWGVGFGATMPTITDGAYFKLYGTVLTIATVANGGAEDEITQGNFNGNLGTSYTPTLTINNTYEILYTLGNVYWFINGVLLHKKTYSTTHWTYNTTNFHVFADVINTGNSAAVTTTFRMMNISRLGNFESMPQYKYISGANTAQILKYGGGLIHTVMIGTCIGNKTIAIYDNTSGTANQIGLITMPTNTDPFALDMNCPFFNGLNITPNDTGLAITIVYE